MSLSNTLNTNEIKNSAGVEVEFSHLEQDGRSHSFMYSTEAPGYPNRLKISHQESGSGTSKRRRSVCRFDKTTNGSIDSTKIQVTSCYCVLDIPVGNLSTYSDAKDVLAQLMSFLATTGAASTVLFDCTGNGASALVNGTL
jgi:hypothetical protein